MTKAKKIRVEELEPSILLLNLYLTQFITLIFAFVLYFFLLKQNPYEVFIQVIYNEVSPGAIIYGIIFSFLIVGIDLIITKTVPKDLIDDGGINEKIFGNIPCWHIVIIAFTVGFSEELLFRGVVQSYMGVYITSIIFTLIHFRYLKKWILILQTFLISLGLGYLTIYFGWVSSFIAHAMIDLFLGMLLQRGFLKSKKV